MEPVVKLLLSEADRGCDSIGKWLVLFHNPIGRCAIENTHGGFFLNWKIGWFFWGEDFFAGNPSVHVFTINMGPCGFEKIFWSNEPTEKSNVGDFRGKPSVIPIEVHHLSYSLKVLFLDIYIYNIYIDDIYHISFLWMVKCFSYIYVSPLPHCCCCSHLHSVAVYLGFQLSAFLRRWHWFATAMGPLWCRSSSTLGLRSPSISSKFDRRKRDIKNNFCLKQIESYKSYIS